MKTLQLVSEEPTQQVGSPAKKKMLANPFSKGKSRDAFARKFYLERLHALVKDNEELFYDALAKDLNKSRAEALSSEISPVLEECAYFLDVCITHIDLVFNGLLTQCYRIMTVWSRTKK